MSEFCPYDVVPLAQSKLIKNNIYTLNHTGQDYWSMKSRMLELIKQNYDKDFNDFTESSLGLMLIEMYAFLADQLSFKIDQISNEVYIDSVTELYNANRICRLVGFKPTPPLPARALFSATLRKVQQIDLPIQTPITVNFMIPGYGEHTMELFAADENNNPVFGQDIVIPAGGLTTTSIVGLEGKTHFTTYVGTGASWQRFEVGMRRVLYKSIRLNVDGQPWEEVEYFTDSYPRKEFRVEYTSDYKAVVIFGNNKSGLSPNKGSTINLSYRVGGGEIGNIVTGSIENSVMLSVPGLTGLTNVIFKNYTKGEGGYDGDGINEIKAKLPVFLRTQNRAVTGGDYKYLADNFASAANGLVGKSTAVLRNHGCAGNIVDIYVLARQGDDLIPASHNLKVDLISEVNKKKMLTDYVCVKDGDIIHVDIHIEIVVDRFQKKYESSLREKINRKLREYFSLYNWEFGQTLKDTDLIKILADINEAEQIDISFTTNKSLEEGRGSVNLVTAKYYEIIRPDSVNIEFSYKNGSQ